MHLGSLLKQPSISFPHFFPLLQHSLSTSFHPSEHSFISTPVDVTSFLLFDYSLVKVHKFLHFPISPQTIVQQETTDTQPVPITFEALISKMQYLAILAVVVTLFFPNAVPQTIDPSTVDEGTKGSFYETIGDKPANTIIRHLV